MIKDVVLKIREKNGEPVRIARPSFTIFVGPNNSGKSLTLREISSLCYDGSFAGFSIIETINFDPMDEVEIEKFFEFNSSPPRFGENVHQEHIYFNLPKGRTIVHPPSLRAALLSPNSSVDTIRAFCQHRTSSLLLNLDGSSRLSLANAKPRGDLKFPTNAFAKILTDDVKRKALRSTILDAIGMFIGFDISVGDTISLKFGRTSPPNERAIEDSTLDWMRAALSEEAVSDGVRAFSGMLIELQGGQPKIITIDEPEAFLHPALAFKLGREMAKVSQQRSQSVFCSTHSSQFVMGAINSGSQVSIVRLTYRDGNATARIMSNESLSAMMRDPLLRSANVMSGIFYESVVVTEADADRAFYQEINERLLDYFPERGVGNALFLNANGKDTIGKIVEPLRRLGIPSAAVLDVDALNMVGSVWAALMRSCGVPKLQQRSISDQRSLIWKSLQKTGGDIKKDGIRLLTGEDLEVAENLLNFLQSYGIFILRNGEVEQWLPELNVPRNKTWLRSIFEAMGDNPSEDSYLRPKDDDVWEFVEVVGVWLKNPRRKGMSIGDIGVKARQNTPAAA